MENLEKEIQEIQERNKRVELDKTIIIPERTKE